MLSRRSFLTRTAAAPVALAWAQRKHVPIGLELYSVREELKQDLMGTLREVAKLGYEGVEFYAPYYEWTTAQAKDVKRLLDDLKIRCFSTHNSVEYFQPEKLPHAIELNQIIGSRYIVMAHPGKVENMDGWKSVAETLTKTAEKLRPINMLTGFHNHIVEWRPVNGTRPMDVIAGNTPRDVVLQLDTATCLSGGSDPVAWIKAHPGRIKSFHMKDWSSDPKKGYRILLGEGDGRWKEIIEAAETVGGVDYYLIEQEGSIYPPIETAKRSLELLRRMRAS